MNAYVTKAGLEMGRAQAVQSEDCGLEPDVRMNPILLKPTCKRGIQVVAFGKVVGNMTIDEYGQYKEGIRAEVKAAYESLLSENDIVVIEGAGSPAEINLGFENDIVNMGMAKMAKSPILLVGDIDRGGVCAALYGTVMLFNEPERRYIKGLIINKMRGHLEVLRKGNDKLEKLFNKPMIGVLPYFEMDIEDEDSISERFKKKGYGEKLNIGVIRLPSLSNATDFATFERVADVNVHYLSSLDGNSFYDLIIIPGSKNTIEDLKWLKKSGIADSIMVMAKKDVPILGICGGYQMLTNYVEAPLTIESGGAIKGLGLLPGHTILGKEKILKQVSGKINPLTGLFSGLEGLAFVGYEMHMGITKNNGYPIASCKSCYGTYVHGILDEKAIVEKIV